MEIIGILSAFTGVMCDALVSYGAARSLCDAHLIRDLDSVHQADPVSQVWAKVALKMLLKANTACAAAREQGLTGLLGDRLSSLTARFGQAVVCGRSVNPDPPAGKAKPYQHRLVNRIRRREDTTRMSRTSAWAKSSRRSVSDAPRSISAAGYWCVPASPPHTKRPQPLWPFYAICSPQTRVYRLPGVINDLSSHGTKEST
jgi:hypothetical protein